MSGQHQFTVDVLILIIRDGQILLTKRAGEIFLAGHWAIPGGKVDAGETVVEAAVREVAEEVGITVDPNHLHFVGVTHHHPPTEASRIGFGFVTELGPDTEPENREPHKCSRLDWFAPDALPEPTMAYTQEIVRLYLDKQPFSIHRWS